MTFVPGWASAADPGSGQTVYTVATAHLDTQWNWTIQTSINQYVLNTLNDNFALFDKYPDYQFNFEGAFRYQLAKEYYPELYDRLIQYVQQGRWNVAGSSWDAGDVNVPSPESLFRNILYGNQYFKREFGKTSLDIFLPDCFGFGYALPSIAAHAGLKGFSTQKLSWGSAYGVPFDIGRWIGPDGSSIAAALKPGGYGTQISSDWSNDSDIINTIAANGAYGVYAAYRYYGTGDVGGSPTDGSVYWIEQAITNPSGPVTVLSTSSDQLFRDLTPALLSGLPSYQGELVMTTHGTGSYSSKTISKRWNRKNELLADAVERAAVMADWFGGAPYPQQRLHDAWTRFIWHQFHDDLTGTSLPAAYAFSWNDYVLSLNQFAGELGNSVGAATRALNTQVNGIPVVVYNPLATDRKDVVEARLRFSGGVPTAVRVYSPNGAEVASQLLDASGEYATVLFLASMSPVSYQVYDVRPASSPSTISTGLSVTSSSLESKRYRVSIDANGDISGVYDKKLKKELLSAPMRLQMLNDNSVDWPSWELLYSDVSATPREYVGGTPIITVVENGPARVALRIARQAASSLFVQTIRLSAGDGDRVEVDNDVDWQTTSTLLKVAFPLSASNDHATYDLGLGTISRPNNTNSLYEVPAQQWADISDPAGTYGVSIMNDSKYGWDKPSNNTLRLTLIHTPSGSFGGNAQDRQELGKNRFLYALYGHSGTWASAGTVWQAARLNQPLLAFQAPSHTGALGKSYSFLSISTPQVFVKAVKKAEDSNEVIVRVQEVSGRAASRVNLALGSGITAAREVNASEETVGSATVQSGSLRFSIGAYQPKTFALTLSGSPVDLTAPSSQPIALPYNQDVISFDDARSDGSFGVSGKSIPGELFPSTIASEGILFAMGPTANGQANALYADGQSISIPSGYRRLYLLAASSNGDANGTFLLNDTPTNLVIQDFRAPVGRWDNDPLGTVASIKRDPVAWVATHSHTPGGNSAYEFAQLFKYRIDLPQNGSGVLKLPKNPNIVILAMTVSDNANDDTVPAGFLYDAAQPSTTGKNLALGKTATGSTACASNEGPALAVDGSTGTKWCSKVDSRWLTIDLGAVQNVGKFVIRHAAAGGEDPGWNTRDFTIDLSTDGSQWSTAVTVTRNTASITTHPIVNTPARYVRLSITTPTSNGDPAARIYEVEVYRDESNLALDRPATGTTACASNEGPEGAVDGSNGTKWCSKVDTRWLIVDLGAVQTLSKFVVRHAGAGGEYTDWNTRDFTIDLSTDGSQWTTAVTVTGNTASVTTHSIPETAARYVRLNVITPTNNGDPAARIYEFEVHPPQSNLAFGQPTTSTTACASNESSEKAVDGSTSTKWCSLVSTKWLRVDLGTVQSIDQFVIRHAGAGGEYTSWNTRDFAIEVSNDDAQWSPVVNVTGNTLNVTTHPVTGVSARYVRLNVVTPTSDGDPAARIYELEVYK